MNEVLQIKNLSKEYPAFHLDNVSFSIEKGHIMGFIGRNGAGKTTTLKSILHLVHPSSGEVSFFSLDANENEKAIKQKIGYASGTLVCYRKKKIREIAAITSSFYDDWDSSQWAFYLKEFALDDTKCPQELSEGMKVKLNLALALSHHAELLILDEPTSGLDPVSRDELLDLFLDLASQGVTILFSTHIITDLEKCADDITYIQKGKILFSSTLKDFENDYLIVESTEPFTEEQQKLFAGECRSKDGTSYLIRSCDQNAFDAVAIRKPGLEEIMVHLERGNHHETASA